MPDRIGRTRSRPTTRRGPPRESNGTEILLQDAQRRRRMPTPRTPPGRVSSHDEVQAQLFLEDAKRFVAVFNAAADSLGHNVIDDEGHTAFTLRLANGLRIHSMSSNVDAQAGKRGDRVLDEFALHPDPKRLYG